MLKSLLTFFREFLRATFVFTSSLFGFREFSHAHMYIFPTHNFWVFQDFFTDLNYCFTGTFLIIFTFGVFPSRTLYDIFSKVACIFSRALFSHWPPSGGIRNKVEKCCFTMGFVAFMDFRLYLHFMFFYKFGTPRGLFWFSSFVEAKALSFFFSGWHIVFWCFSGKIGR